MILNLISTSNSLRYSPPLISAVDAVHIEVERFAFIWLRPISASVKE